MEVNTIKQEKFEKMVKAYFESSNFSDEKKAEFAKLFIKYSRYYEVKKFCLEMIKNSYELSKKTYEDLQKVDFKDSVEKELYDAIMNHNYLADVHDVSLEAQKAITKEHNEIVDEINKSTSEKSTNIKKIKNIDLRKEKTYLEELNEKLNKMTKKTYKESQNAKKTINKRKTKIKKKNNKRK